MNLSQPNSSTFTACDSLYLALTTWLAQCVLKAVDDGPTMPPFVGNDEEWLID